MAFPHFNRRIALRILQAAFYRAAHEDYVNGHVHNEEDIRASTYRHARAAFDLDDTWRLFTNLTAFSNPTETEETRDLFRPDMSLFQWLPGTDYPRIEIFVEIKHWPSGEGKVRHDLAKLTRLREEYLPERPDIAFFAIVGKEFLGTDVANLAAKLSEEQGAHVWLVPHFGENDAPLYKSHRNEKAGLDPWRARLRHITTGNYFAQKGTVISDKEQSSS